MGDNDGNAVDQAVFSGNENHFGLSDKDWAKKTGNWNNPEEDLNDQLNGRFMSDDDRRAARGLPPIAAAYTQGWNQNMAVDPWAQGQLGRFQGGMDKINLDRSGLNQYSREAQRTGPSNFYNMESARQTALAGQNRAQVAGQAQAGFRQGMGNLAAQGGLNSGARQSLGREAIRARLMGVGDVSRNHQNNMMQLGSQDEQNRMRMLQAEPGMQGQAMQSELNKQQLGLQGSQFGLQSKMYDVGQQVGENNRSNLYNEEKYKQQMGVYGGNQMAEAIRNMKD